MDEDGVYSTGKGRAPKYTLPKGRTTKLGKKLKNMNVVPMQTIKSNRELLSRGKLFVDATDSCKHTLSKVDEFILQTQGKTPIIMKKFLLSAESNIARKVLMTASEL